MVRGFDYLLLLNFHFNGTEIKKKIVLLLKEISIVQVKKHQFSRNSAQLEQCEQT
jgi:hypothetical protein